MATLCEKIGVLPRPGGLLEQDYYHVILLNAAFAAKATKEEKDNKDKQREMDESGKKRGR